MDINFIAVGPQKTGTTWLYKVLENSEEICFPRHVKETMFFDIFYDEGYKRYESYFSHRKPHQICGEIAPTYFDVPGLPERIYKNNPNCKIIISLRNPAQRAFSLYCHYLRNGEVPHSLEMAIQEAPRIIEAGYYKEHITRWLNVFPRKNIYFFVMDDIQKNPKLLLERIYNFIEIDNLAEHLNDSIYQKVNQSRMPKFPSVARSARKVIKFLRAHQLDNLVESLKSFPLEWMFSGNEENMPRLTDKELKFLLDIYEKDILFVEGLMQLNLHHWKSIKP